MFIYKKLLSNPTVDSNFWRRAVEVYSILHVLGALYNAPRTCNGFKTFQKSHVQKFQKYSFKLFVLLMYYNVQLASIKNISSNYKNMDLTSKQIWPQCGYLAGKAHASKRPKLQVLQTTGTFPMIATWFLLAAKTSYYLLGRP